MSPGALHRQLVRTVGVDVRVAGGHRAVVVLARPTVEGARDGVNGHGQIVAIHQADVVEVHALVLVEGDLRQRGRQCPKGAVALNFAAYRVVVVGELKGSNDFGASLPQSPVSQCP